MGVWLLRMPCQVVPKPPPPPPFALPLSIIDFVFSFALVLIFCFSLGFVCANDVFLVFVYFVFWGILKLFIFVVAVFNPHYLDCSQSPSCGEKDTNLHFPSSHTFLTSLYCTTYTLLNCLIILLLYRYRSLLILSL